MMRTDNNRTPSGATSKIRGFTIVELLVAMVIAGLVMGAIYSVFISSNRSYRTQDRVADTQQGLRLGLDFMVRDIRMAGLSPRADVSFGIEEATATRIRFTSDTDWSNWDADLDLPDATTERMTYEFDNTDADPTKWILRRGFGDSGSETWQTLVENVSGLTFQYLDGSNTVLATPVAAVQLPQIKTVVITMVMQDTNAEGQTFNRTLSTRVRCRNL